MGISEALMAAAITVGAAGVSYVAFSPEGLSGAATSVADRATCRAVNEAILGYVSLYDRAPRRIADLEPFLDGDIAEYRITGGVAAGPGC